ncbi:MAG: sensor histidine kinase [Mycobacterium sp.]
MATLLGLLTLVCAGIGVGAITALRRYLTAQLDSQVFDAGWRSAAMVALGPPPAHRDGTPRFPDGPGPHFLDGPGQASGTAGAVLSDGQVLEAAVITDTGSQQPLTARAFTQLAGADYPTPGTVDLDGLGSYRVITMTAPNGTDVLLTGLPTEGLDNAVLSVLGIIAVIVAVAFAAVSIAGILIIRRQLAPLSAVAAAAGQVADSDSGGGDMRLPKAIVSVEGDATYTEVGRLGSALNRMLVRIADAMEARRASELRVRQFVADASHELRTPLAAIRGYAELAQRDGEAATPAIRHAMDRIDSESRRMSILVGDMLLLARLDAGRPLESEEVDVSQLVLDAVSDAHIAGHDHRWQLDIPDEPVAVRGDRARLHQVLTNLLANARAHTPAGTNVLTSVSADDHGRVIIAVRDDGPGIPTDQQASIFERFVRGDVSRSRRDGGTGLGLAIVSAVVKAHHGSIAVDSEPGATTFTVTLPGPAT